MLAIGPEFNFALRDVVMADRVLRPGLIVDIQAHRWREIRRFKILVELPGVLNSARGDAVSLFAARTEVAIAFERRIRRLAAPEPQEAASGAQ